MPGTSTDGPPFFGPFSSQEPLPPHAEIAAYPPMNVHDLARRIGGEMRKAIFGQEELLELLTVALVAGGHVLLEGVPGTAKTLTVRVLARVVNASFARIQFTPDLMPSDVLGTSIFDPRTQEFSFRKGPVFAGLLLADEINRTPPKTQSALLEAMEERQVTIDGQSYDLPAPFIVCATQNPIEYEGTYPLPEAQLDRFLFKLIVGYPVAEQEEALLNHVKDGFRPRELDTAGVIAVVDAGELERFQDEVGRVTVTQSVLQYIVRIARATRESADVLLGASPRASVALLAAARASAAIHGRDYVTPDDVKQLCYPVLRHRLMLRPEAEVQGTTADRVIYRVLEAVEVPR